MTLVEMARRWNLIRLRTSSPLVSMGPLGCASRIASGRLMPGWRGLPIREIVFYEVHGGTFIPEGTFEAIVPRLRERKDLGWDRVMPVSQFPGTMNWAARRVEKGPEFSRPSLGGTWIFTS